MSCLERFKFVDHHTIVILLCDAAGGFKMLE